MHVSTQRRIRNNVGHSEECVDEAMKILYPCTEHGDCKACTYIVLPYLNSVDVASNEARAPQVWLKHDVGTLSQTRTQPPAKGQLSTISYSCVLWLPIERLYQIAKIN